MYSANPPTESIEVVVAEPMVVLVWGDGSLTTVPDDRRFGSSAAAHTSPLQNQLMAVRLRYLADELDAVHAAGAT